MTFLAMSRFSLYFWRQLRLPKHQHGFDCKNGMAIRIGWRMLQCFHKNFFKRCCVYLSFAGGVFGAIGERVIISFILSLFGLDMQSSYHFLTTAFSKASVLF